MSVVGYLSFCGVRLVGINESALSCCARVAGQRGENGTHICNVTCRKFDPANAHAAERRSWGLDTHACFAVSA